MNPYSTELRGKILAAYEKNEYPHRAVAALFGVSAATVRNLVRAAVPGSADAFPHSGGKAPTLNGKKRGPSCPPRSNSPLSSLEELVQWVERKHRKRGSLATRCRV